MTTTRNPIRLAIVDDYAVVVAGVAAFLQAERIDVVETGATRSVISDVDIVLYDTFGQIQGEGIDLEDFVRDSGGAKVVVYCWNLNPQLIEDALAGGASGYLSKVLTGPAIADALERINAGEIVVLAGDFESSVGGAGDWPGREVGLSPREAEMIALITQGLSNQEIADRAYLSINSVKSYIRSAYRKIGVTKRTQAVIWGIDNGFKPDTLRIIDPPSSYVVPRPRDPDGSGRSRGQGSLLRCGQHLGRREHEHLDVAVAVLRHDRDGQPLAQHRVDGAPVERPADDLVAPVAQHDDAVAARARRRPGRPGRRGAAG